MIDTLSKIALFEDLDHGTLADISLFCSCVTLDDGDVLISENDTGNYHLYALLSGKVEVLTACKPITSAEVVLANRNLEILGEISWLRDTRRTATVRAVGIAEAIKIDGPKLKSYLSNNTEAGFMVMQRLACKLADRLQNTDILLKQILWNSNI